MKLTNSAQMRAVDRHAIDNLGIPGASLMSVAAQHVAAAAMENCRGGTVAVFCGTGNNGGDGIGAAAHLLQNGISARVFLIGDVDSLTQDSQEMRLLLESQGGAIENFTDARDVYDALQGCDVIIDAIFGTGLNDDVRGDALLAIKMINSSDAYTISADIPSGVCADTGRVLSCAVSADVTVTFSVPKAGQHLEPGCTHCGEVRVCDIGIPQDLLHNLEPHSHAVMPGDITLPRRELCTHKGDYGRVLIVASSVGYTGAPALCARAASRMGAGLVYVGVPRGVYDIMAVKLDEEMPFPLSGDASLTLPAADEIISRADTCDVLLLGPGLSQSADVSSVVSQVLRSVTIPVVLDADGINAIAENIDILDEATCPVILTPHPGEFARIGGDLSGGDRLGAARRFAQAHGCIVVLKGHRTITAMPDGSSYINTTGGPAMAKGGSGDVLAGMIAALIGQKFPLQDAALAAVYIHGLAGDMCADRCGDYSVTAGDITDMLRAATKQVMER